MKRHLLTLLVTGWLAGLSSGCLVFSPPQTPQPRPVPRATLAFVVTDSKSGNAIEMAEVDVAGNDAPVDATTNADGYAAVQWVIPSTVNFAVRAPGYVETEFNIEQSFTGNTQVSVTLDPVEIEIKETGIQFVGPIHVDGRIFRDASGKAWTWRFVTEFLLLNDLLDGKDITPILDEVVAIGANGVRVIGMAHYIPLNERGQRDFVPSNYGDNYFSALGTLADMLQKRGLYLEFTALADAQMLMSAPRDQRVFVEKVAGVLTSKPNAFLEHCNEPFKNGCGDELAMGRIPGPLLQASGNYDVDELDDRYVLRSVFDYVTNHPPRDDEWARKVHDAMDLRDGFSNNGKNFPGARVPVVLDEPIGAADVAVPGRRASDPNLFRQFGAGSAMFGSGATFHSNAGVATKPMSSVQRAAAVAFFAGMNAVDPEASLWQYNRGGLTGMPVAHSDSLALRTFAKITGGAAYVVVIQHTADWRLIEENGYHCTSLVPEGDVLKCTR